MPVPFGESVTARVYLGPEGTVRGLEHIVAGARNHGVTAHDIDRIVQHLHGEIASWRKGRAAGRRQRYLYIRPRRTVPGSSHIPGVRHAGRSGDDRSVDNVNLIAEDNRAMLESCGEPIGHRGRRGHPSPVGTVFGRPHDIRRGCGSAGCTADHVDIAPRHNRSMVPAWREMIGYGKAVARRFSLVGRLNGDPLGGARAGHFIIDFPTETHRAGGGIQGDRAGIAGGFDNGVCYTRGDRSRAQEQFVGEGLGGTAVGGEEYSGPADFGVLEGEPHCRRINGCRGIDPYRRIAGSRQLFFVKVELPVEVEHLPGGFQIGYQGVDDSGFQGPEGRANLVGAG